MLDRGTIDRSRRLAIDDAGIDDLKPSKVSSQPTFFFASLCTLANEGLVAV
jgi:hypothetical protein